MVRIAPSRDKAETFWKASGRSHEMEMGAQCHVEWARFSDECARPLH